MLKTFLKIVFFAGGLVVLALAANFIFDKQKIEANNLIEPIRLRASAYSHDFGFLPMAAGTQRHQFEIRNASPEPVEISKFYTSCRCVAAKLIIGGRETGKADFVGNGFLVGQNQIVLPSNQSAIVEVVFDPAATGPAGAGLRESFVYLEDRNGAPLRLEIRALVRL